MAGLFRVLRLSSELHVSSFGALWTKILSSNTKGPPRSARNGDGFQTVSQRAVVLCTIIRFAEAFMLTATGLIHPVLRRMFTDYENGSRPSFLVFEKLVVIHIHRLVVRALRAKTLP